LTTDQRVQIADAAARIYAAGRSQSLQEAIEKIVNCIKEESLWVA
jgi:hypothetical protein